MKDTLKRRWIAFWMRRADLTPLGRLATRLATIFAPPYKARCYLAKYNPIGYVSPSATLSHNDLRLGKHVFLGDRVIVYQSDTSGFVELGKRVQLYGDVIIETTFGGCVTIGDYTHIQPRCQLVAGKASIVIGKRVEIAANCAFYPYNHGMVHGIPIREQPLESRGDIVVGDDVWLGFGVIVLDGVTIGDGAVIGAGSVVTGDVPSNAIAVGVPAKVIRFRKD